MQLHAKVPVVVRAETLDRARAHVPEARNDARIDARIDARPAPAPEPEPQAPQPPPDSAPHGWREQLGHAVGALASPAIFAIAKLRGARMFHPEGASFTGHCEPVGKSVLGHRLAGRVLARCSPALSRTGREQLEVLGIALRFRAGEGAALDHLAAPGDQDLLFATIPSPLALAVSPLTTDATDFLDNRYWAVSPFATGARERVELRLTPIAPRAIAGSRDLKLRTAVAIGAAQWWLEARDDLARQWHHIARIKLDRAARLDDTALRFDPFRAGAGFTPVGFVHAIRRAAYAASQRARG